MLICKNYKNCKVEFCEHKYPVEGKHIDPYFDGKGTMYVKCYKKILSPTDFHELIEYKEK